jgi:hypothetical protein
MLLVHSVPIVDTIPRALAPITAMMCKTLQGPANSLPSYCKFLAGEQQAFLENLW